MISLKEVKEDLKDIRYFYLRKKVFVSNVRNTGVTSIQRKAERYNTTIIEAPAQMYDLYIGLYIDGKTQSCFASDIGYSEKYIQRQNKQLLLYLQKNLKEE